MLWTGVVLDIVVDRVVQDIVVDRGEWGVAELALAGRVVHTWVCILIAPHQCTSEQACRTGHFQLNLKWLHTPVGKPPCSYEWRFGYILQGPIYAMGILIVRECCSVSLLATFIFDPSFLYVCIELFQS